MSKKKIGRLEVVRRVVDGVIGQRHAAELLGITGVKGESKKESQRVQARFY